MLHSTPNRFIVALLALSLTVTGCLQEADLKPQGKQEAKGRIVLTLSDLEVYVDAPTRSTQTLSDFTGYTFTLNGEAVESGHVSYGINFDENSTAIIEAGTYTLTASNRANAGNGYSAPYWEGTSSQFTLSVGGTQSVSIALGKPRNAKILVDSTTNEVFRTKYEHVRLTLSDGSHSTTIARAGTTGCVTEAYFPALDEGTSLTYTLTARARLNSHVTDINSATGTITVTRGCQHTVTLTANGITGEIIPIVSGQHTGMFD